MEKHVSNLFIVIAVFALLIGGLVGYNMAPVKVVTEIETEIVYQNVSVYEIEYISLPSQLDLAVAAFLEAVEDEEDEAGNLVNVLGSYDFDEVSVSKVYDDYSVDYNDDQVTVEFSIKLKFNEDGEASEKQVYDVEVVFEESEDTKVYA